MFDHKKEHKKIQKVSRDVLYAYKVTYEIWGLKLQNWQNTIEVRQAPLAGNTKSNQPDLYDPTCFGFFFVEAVKAYSRTGTGYLK